MNTTSQPYTTFTASDSVHIFRVWVLTSKEGTRTQTVIIVRLLHMRSILEKRLDKDDLKVAFGTIRTTGQLFGSFGHV